MSKTYSAGIVTAYGSAVRAGYTGTYEDFCRQQAQYAQNASAVEQAKQTAVSASQSANQAKQDAQTASTTAQQSAQSAQGSAQSAQQSAQDAQTAKNNAQTYAQSASQSAGSAQQSAQSAQAVLESIPEDYSDLSEDVDKLKADLDDLDNDVNDLKSAFGALAKPVFDWIDDQYIKSNGDIANNSGYHRTGLIDVGNTGNIFKYTQMAYNNLGINIYDKNQSRITTLELTTSTTVVPVTGVLNLADYPNARYIEFSEQKVNGIFNLQLTQEYKKMLSIPDGSISTVMLADKAVTLPKTSFTIHDPETNFIDKNALIDGKIINQTGAVASAKGWCCTDYIELTPGTRYYISDYVYRKYWGFYNASKEVVGCYNNDGELVYSFTFPSGAKYARFSVQNTTEYVNGAYVSINSGKPFDYGYTLDVETKYPTEYDGMDVSTFNKVLCIGDSLTYGYFNRNSGATADYASMAAKYSYPTQFKKITGVNTTNKGDSGKTTAEWYSLHGNEDLSGHDACIIELGTNDGTWSATSETAMSNIITKVKADNKGIKIFVSTIPNGKSYVASTYKAINAGIRAYVAGLNDADVYFIDLEAYGHMIQSAGYDAGHLSAYGYWRLAKDYANYISYIMNKNKNAFRLVQFTGTDDTYTP